MSETRNLSLLGKITVLIICCLVIGLCVNTALALDGSGTEQDPWRIKSLEDFNDFASDANYWDDYTRLETDVNLAGQIYSTAVIAPDANNSNWIFDGIAFTGVFDGNDKRIINLTIDDGGAGNEYLGLFGFIDDGEVSNLCLEGGSVSGEWMVGGLVGENWGIISNCYSTGDVSGEGLVGGLVGGNWFSGKISNCYSTGSVSGTDVGGLVGSNGGSISNCYSTVNVSGGINCGFVGGLVGSNHSGTITNCYSTGNVIGSLTLGDFVGGLVGILQGGFVSNCYSTGDVSCGWSAGGLVGYNYGTITNSYSTGSVTGESPVGGLVGFNHSNGSVSNSYSNGDVSGNDYAGGLVGVNLGSISDCYSNGNVSGESRVGGLVGEDGGYRTFYTSCFWDIDINPDVNGIGNITDPNVVGLPTAEMQTESTFTEAGWDFVEIWNIGENQTYPYLRVYLAGDINKDRIVNFLDIAITANQWIQEQ